MQKWNLFWNEFDERNVEIITVIINYLKVIREDVISDFFYHSMMSGGRLLG